MQRDTGVAQDVEAVLESLEESQREIADKWTEVMRTTARPNQNDVTEAILRSQNEIMRMALRWMDPATGFGALAGKWITLPKSLAATTLELQRRTLQAFTAREELRPEALAQRWSQPWLEVTRAYQEAATRMVEIQSSWMRSVASRMGEESEESARPRSSSQSGRGRGRAKSGGRTSGNGRRTAQSQRAH
jgi:hypothetical protein